MHLSIYIVKWVKSCTLHIYWAGPCIAPTPGRWLLLKCILHLPLGHKRKCTSPRPFSYTRTFSATPTHVGLFLFTKTVFPSRQPTTQNMRHIFIIICLLPLLRKSVSNNQRSLLCAVWAFCLPYFSSWDAAPKKLHRMTLWRTNKLFSYLKILDWKIFFCFFFNKVNSLKRRFQHIEWRVALINPREQIYEVQHCN